MQNSVLIEKDLYYVGGSDRRIPLFESAYPVPRGVSYNSYLLLDEKTALFDTVDKSVSEVFFENVESVLGGRNLDYLVIHHMEPDHSASFEGIVSRYPNVKVVVNQKIAAMLKNFFSCDLPELIIVKDGDTLSFGKHTHRFVFAPMVHWPEVMLSFDETTGTLFSADAFGTFGALSGSLFADEVEFEKEFLDDARRYYFNIVGKYGVQVQNVLKKAATLPIKTVCPLHGPVWRKDFSWFLNKYDIWSKYEPEEKGVAVYFASIYGHTGNAAEILATALAENGVPVKTYDTSFTHYSELLSEAFRYSHVVFAAPTYNNGIFVSMEQFLNELVSHNYQNRAFALIENGSWAPQANKLMREKLASLKGMREIGEGVTMLSSVKEDSKEKLYRLAKDIALDLTK
ncbi:MAG: FprA family A-type flavoprotein [Clostridia bacterium]|nr:FprA family A-type flavoprotein [Clostridia bacterium]